MGKAARRRGQQREQERRQRRAAQPGSRAETGQRAGPAAGPRHSPSGREAAVALVGDAISALCAGQRDAYDTTLARLADTESPDWTRTVSQSIVGFLRASVTAAWRRGWQPAELARHIGRGP